MIPSPLLHAAAAARRRLLLAAWWRLLTAAAPWFLAAAIGAVLVRLAGHGVPAWVAGGVGVWLAAAAWRIWRRRPDAAAALAAWDRAAGLDDLLLNAWDFTARADQGRFAAAHVVRALARLPVLMPDLPRHLPVRIPPSAVVAPLLLVALVGSGLMAPPAGDSLLDAAARERLARQTAEVAQDAERLPDAALDKAEKDRLDELRKRIREAQEKAREEGLGRPDALRELDKLARKAEELAALLADTQQASAALLAELERHADTADLAAALKAADPAKAAAEAEALAKKLERKDLTLDEQRRLAQALERAAAAGDRSQAGQAIADANTAMQAGDPAAAGARFQQLGAQLARAGQRQQAARQVGALANRLRASGGKMLALAPNANARPMTLSNLPPVRLSPNARPGQGDPKGPLRQAIGTPPPGGRAGACPVPGTAPGDGAGAGGACPVPGAGMAAAGMSLAAAPGGSRAGHGHMPTSQASTAARAATGTSIVDAAKGNGEGEQRQVAGQAHQEGSAIAPDAAPLTIVDAEEKALDADPLPAARREQVKAYFSILRSQLER